MPHSVMEMICEAIREEITYGELLPGGRLIEKDFSEKYKTSRSTIRECFRLLEGEELLTYTKNKGYCVSRLSAKQVKEIYELWGLLYGYATRLTTRRTTRAQVDLLKRLQEGCQQSAVRHDLKSWITFNDQFHSFFHDGCNNDKLKSLISTYGRRTYRYKYIVLTGSDQFAAYLEEHETIIAACEKQDGCAAEKAMRQHLEHVKEVMLNHIKAYSGLFPHQGI